MRYQQITPSLFIKNRKKLVDKLPPNAIAFINANDEMPRNGDQNFPFRQNSDLFYLTGIEQEKTILALCPGHPDPGKREILFINKPESQTELWDGEQLTSEESKNISGIKDIRWLYEFHYYIGQIINKEAVFYCNSNENNRFETEVPYRDIRFMEDLKKRYPQHNIQKLAPYLSDLRIIKEPEEIELLRKACSITKEAFNHIVNIIKPGVKEYEIEAEMIRCFIAKGANGHAFEPIIASGKNACTLHYTKNDDTCQDGELVLIDFGAEYANYASDCTRTLPVNGKFTPRQRELYKTTHKILKETEKMMVPGETINNIQKKVCKLWENEHIKLNLYTKKDVEQQDEKHPLYSKYFMHGVSHFLGLDVHDTGDKQQELKPGMVITCEPGIYINEENTGIRLENDILITQNNPVNLTKDIPVEIDEIEKLLTRKK